MCKWIIAISKYDKVAKVIAPKKIALAEAEKAFSIAMASLELKRAQLKQIQERLAKLEVVLEETKVKIHFFSYILLHTKFNIFYLSIIIL